MVQKCLEAHLTDHLHRVSHHVRRLEQNVRWPLYRYSRDLGQLKDFERCIRSVNATEKRN